jgi:putative transcriptional regulator
MPTPKKRVPISDSDFDEMVDEARAIRVNGVTEQRVHTIAIPESVDVAAIRAELGLTQAEFAARFGFGIRAVHQWEQGTRRPAGPARVLLALIAADSKAISRLLKKAGLAVA